MKNSFLKSALGILLSAALFAALTSCSSGASGDPGNIFKVVDFETAVGAATGSVASTQVITYSLTLQNTSSRNLYVQNIDLVAAGELETRILLDSLIKGVSRNIPAGGTFQVSSQVPFDASNLTKEDIDKINPLFTQVKVTSEVTVDMPE